MRFEYKVMQISPDERDTEFELNDYAKKGWRLVCSYCGGKWFVLERRIKTTKDDTFWRI